MKKIKRILNIKSFRLALRYVKNWPIYLLDFLGLLGGEEVVYKLKNGLRMFARSNTADRGIINCVILKDEYRLKNFKRNDLTVIDLGGQNGYFSLWACSRAKDVYVYEPTYNFQEIQKNIKLNDLEQKIHPFNLAVSGHGERLKLYIAPGNTAGHSSYFKSGECVEVDSVTLKDIFDRNRISKCDLLKVDIEGGEYDIFYNLPDDYFTRISNIHMEAHEIDIGEKNPPALAGFLAKKGFTVERDGLLLFASRQ